MLAWIRSPRGSTATATVVAVILALFWLAPWQKPLPSALRLPFAMSTPAGPAPAPAPSDSTAPAVSSQSGPAQSAAGPTSPPTVASLAPADPAQTTAVASSTSPSAMAAPAASAKDQEKQTVPAFDVVRVEPTGESVVAGRAAPGSEVALLDGEAVIAHGQADATGQFAFVPPSLAEGSHYLSLQTQHVGQEPVRSLQGVAIALAPKGATKPLVALLSPDKPAEVLSDGITPTTSVSGAAAVDSHSSKSAVPGPAAAPVAIQSVQAGQNGNFLAAGVAHPGSQCRVYLNGAYLADVTAGQDGKWSVEIKKGMQPGRYTVRADELDPVGAVSHRVEVPFEYPATLAGAKPAGGAKRLLLSRTGPEPTTVGGSTVPPASGTAPVPGVATGSLPPGSAAPSATRGPLTAAVPGAAPATRLAAGQADGSAASGIAARAAPTTAEPANGAPALVASATPPSASAAPSSPAAAVIPDLHTTTVIRGDSLWRISRKMLGHGIQYTEIYASNTNQIRDPSLIYPGQIFVVPSKRTNG